MPKMKLSKKISSKNFILIISLYFSFILNTSFWHFIINEADLSNYKMRIAIFVLPFFIFAPLYIFYSIITVPFVGKSLIILLLFISTLTDYAMQKLGIIIDSTMMRNVMQSNLREMTDLLNIRIFIHLFIKAFLPALWVLWVDISYQNRKTEIKQRLLRCGLFLLIPLLFAPLSYKYYVSFGRNHQEIRHLINTFNYASALRRFYKKQNSANHELIILDDAPKRLKEDKTPPRVLVYVVGETARAANFSLYGYDKETNPELKKEDVIIFKNVKACGTSTAISLPCMFSLKPQKDFNISTADYTQNMLDIIQLAQYDIYWKDNDDGCKNVCRRVHTDDAKWGNIAPYCFSSYCHDEILLDGLEEKIANITKDTLIVLHMMGSHGPSYYKRYPLSFEKFTPACHTSDLPECSKEEIVNTYDNTILYTDYVLAEIIHILKRYPALSSAMLYISDHGESLGENNIYLHALPYMIAPETQKKVPMILWLSEQIKKDLSIDTAQLKEEANKEEFSHDNLSPSILHLLSVQTTADAKNHKRLNIFNKTKQSR